MRCNTNGAFCNTLAVVWTLAIYTSETEYARWEAARDKRDALLRLWVLKEAAAKLSGDGLRGYPNGTDFSPADIRIKEIDGCYVAVLKENDHAF